MRHRVKVFILIFSFVLAGATWALRGVSADLAGLKPVDFNREIRSILSDNCFACHGPDEKQRMAKLRLDTREGALGKPGVIVPGRAADSKLIKRVTAKDPDVVMPPPDSGHKLTEHQIELLKRWIDEGAQWNEHWAYQAPRRPAVPEVRDSSRVRNPIDSFILARLEKEGMKPSPEADRITLLRRVYFDLTGLPPSPAETDAFLADRSPDAYEQAVDRLFASPHYGERMAMQWLDLARYADTHGYHIDSQREMWPWRDWVIRAFNRNLPFDQFTVEQLAGDLLPGATREQKVASGFNRNHMVNFEGGAIPEEYQNEYVIDRVETTSNTWMALTMGCARCHTHKYDPISQKEFYQFYAFFNNVPEKGLDGQLGNAEPFLPLPADEPRAKQEELEQSIKDHEKQVDDKLLKPLRETWEAGHLGRVAVAPRQDLIALYELDGSLSDASGQYRHGRTVSGDPSFNSGPVNRAVSLDGVTQLSFGQVGAFDRDRPFTLAVWMRPNIGKLTGVAFRKTEEGPTRRGYELTLEASRLLGPQRWGAPLTVRLISNWPASAIQIRTRELFNSGEWKHLSLVYDGSGRAAGLKIYLNGQPAEVEVLQDRLDGPIGTQAELLIGGKAPERGYNGGLDDLRFYGCSLSPEEVERLAVHYPIYTVLSGVGGKKTPEEERRLRNYFLTYFAPDETRRQYLELKDLRKEKEQLDQTIPSVMVMGDLTKSRESFLLGRGDYRNKVEKVVPGVPAILPPLPKEAPLNRLTLAKWLVDPGHPLTARVAVNHYWQLFFGQGIVKTAEDFGVQGEQPVHPELLDWLATEFIRTGWDVKKIQRLIVTSSTYRQSSKVTPALLEKDPENRWLARGPRFRLPAELVRDNALALSGLLTEDLGGPSVFPYQPAGLWEELAFGDGFSAQTYVQSHGKDLYRRSMYTFWKRTVPPAALITFDAPDREKCLVRRALTNTPLQALVLMNDPTYLEAARVLAQRVLREGGKDSVTRLSFAFRSVTLRRPTVPEMAVLRNLLNKQLATYRADRRAAQDLLGVGESPVETGLNQSELAAWTMVLSAILNLDETITKE